MPNRYPTLRAKNSGSDNFRQVLSADGAKGRPVLSVDRAATSLGAQCSLRMDQRSPPVLRGDGSTTPKGRLEYLRRLGVLGGKLSLFHRFSA